MTPSPRPVVPVDLSPPLCALLDQVADGIVVLDGTGRPLFVNVSARLLLGVGPGDPVGGAELRSRALALGGRTVSLPRELGGSGDALVIPAAGEGTLAERERSAILRALGAAHGRLAETARSLGISRTTLWRRLKTYGLERTANRR